MNINFDPLKDFVKDYLKDVPWFSYALAIILLLLIVFYGGTLIFRAFKNDIDVDFWGLKINSNRELLKIKDEFSYLNQNDQLKTNILKLLNQANITVPKWLNVLKGNDNIQNHLQYFYDFYLPGILSLLTKEKDNSLRIAIFVKDNNELRILKGNGYSPEGTKNLRLGITNTKAGLSYINNEVFISNNLTTESNYKRHPKATKEYKSLICVPISYDEVVLGVLNIDGLKEDSFDKDDSDFVNYFATALAPLLNIHLENCEKSLYEEAYNIEKSSAV